MPATSPSPDDLLAHAGWLSALARSLVRDGAAAEDLVQETWIAALRHAPSEPGRLKPWLARVLANFAHRRHRARERRARHEALAARAEAQASSSDVAARLEVQRLLVAALDDLPEPYKGAVVLRYLDGLDSAEIARRQGVPASTARWRLQEGLARLRRILDARCGGERERWVLAVLPFVPRPDLVQLAGGALAGTVGVVLMSLAARGTWIAALLIAGALGLYALVNHTTSPQVVDSGGSETRLVDELASTPGGDAPVHLDERALGSADREHGAQPEVRMSPGTAALEGRVVDDLHRPIAGAEIELLERSRLAEGPATSGADGRFHLALATFDTPRSASFAVRSEGHTAHGDVAQLEPGRVHELGEIVLSRAARVRGRVVDAHGAPAVDVRVVCVPAEKLGELARVRRFGPGVDPAPAARTDAGGRYEIADAAPGVARVCAGADASFWAVSDALELVPAGRHDASELVLEPLDRPGLVTGRVLAPDGSPVAGARVAYTYDTGRVSGNASTFSGADGAFTIDVKHITEYVLAACDPQQRWRDTRAHTTLPGGDPIELRFTESRACVLRARDPSGAPVASLEVDVRLLGADGEVLRMDGIRSVSAKSGEPPGERTFQVPLGRFSLAVAARGYAPQVLGPFEPDATPRELACTLAPRPGVRGRVLVEGRPIAGARVALHAVVRGQTVTHNEFETHLEPQPADDVRTDAEGGFVVHTSFAGEFALLCDADGCATSEVALGDVDPAEARAELAIELGRGGAIEGRVLVPSGEDPAGVIVAFDRRDGRARTLRADKDGRYRLERLTPGPWRVVRAAREIHVGSDDSSYAGGTAPEPVWSCVVEAGKTTTYDLDLRAAPAELLARVTCDGQPAVGWKLRLTPDGFPGLASDAPRAAIDGRGEARISLPAGGGCALELTSSAESGAEIVFTTRVTLLPGPNAWSFGVERGRVAGHVAPARAAKWRHELVWQLADCQARIAITPGDEGRFELPFVPAGTWAVLTSAKRGFADGSAAPPVAVIVEKGATARVELP